MGSTASTECYRSTIPMNSVQNETMMLAGGPRNNNYRPFAGNIFGEDFQKRELNNLCEEVKRLEMMTKDLQMWHDDANKSNDANWIEWEKEYKRREEACHTRACEFECRLRLLSQFMAPTDFQTAHQLVSVQERGKRIQEALQRMCKEHKQHLSRERERDGANNLRSAYSVAEQEELKTLREEFLVLDNEFVRLLNKRKELKEKRAKLSKQVEELESYEDECTKRLKKLKANAHYKLARLKDLSEDESGIDAEKAAMVAQQNVTARECKKANCVEKIATASTAEENFKKQPTAEMPIYMALYNNNICTEPAQNRNSLAEATSDFCKINSAAKSFSDLHKTNSEKLDLPTYEYPKQIEKKLLSSIAEKPAKSTAAAPENVLRYMHAGNTKLGKVFFEAAGNTQTSHRTTMNSPDINEELGYALRETSMPSQEQKALQSRTTIGASTKMIPNCRSAWESTVKENTCNTVKPTTPATSPIVSMPRSDFNRHMHFSIKEFIDTLQCSTPNTPLETPAYIDAIKSLYSADKSFADGLLILNCFLKAYANNLEVPLSNYEQFVNALTSLDKIKEIYHSVKIPLLNQITDKINDQLMKFHCKQKESEFYCTVWYEVKRKDYMDSN